ncbi:MAG: ribonuclease E/G [Lachnospiraceae bacterium]|nr:ribonuclease E/G [Lachnospiraceae bacterium]
MKKKREEGKLVITRIENNILSLLMNDDNEIEQIYCDGGRFESLVGNIYVGRVTNIIDNINGAFVEYASGRSGFMLLDDEPDPTFADINRDEGPIRCGDMLLVQITKDASKNKEPVLTTNITLTGKYIVLTTKNPGLHFSAKFRNKEKSAEILERYEQLGPKEYGFIIRTNAANAPLDSIFEEIDLYSQLWLTLRDCGYYKKKISQIYSAPKSYLASIRDGYDEKVHTIITDNNKIYKEISDYLTVYQPDDADKLQLYDNPYVSLDVLYSIRSQIEDVLSERVWLKSGGYLIIQPTEALISIDVNTGKYVSKRDAQREFLKINLEAAEEIARQIRLRNLSGIIVVDFINMKSAASRDLLLKAFEGYLKRDPQKTTLVDMTKLNLVEVTRKKERRPLYELMDI